MIRSFGLLILRLAVGWMMLIAHGLPKYQSFAEKADVFPDPLGMGSKLSLMSAIGNEIGFSLLLILGLLTRVASTGLAFTMGVAAFVVHASDPWAKKELAVLYLIAYVTLILTGPGQFSVDHALFGRKKKNKAAAE